MVAFFQPNSQACASCLLTSMSVVFIGHTRQPATFFQPVELDHTCSHAVTRCFHGFRLSVSQFLWKKRRARCKSEWRLSELLERDGP